MSDVELLRVTFTHSNTVREKRPFTIYEIEVRAPGHSAWTIYKRYTAFYALHQQLAKQIQTLPTLPPKRLTRSLAAEFVEKRKLELHDYLRSLLELPSLLQSPVVWQFLEVPDSVRPALLAASVHRSQSALLASLYPHAHYHAHAPHAGQQSAHADAGGVDPNFAFGKFPVSPKSVEERRCVEFIASLSSSPNKVRAIESFTAWFFEQKPRLAPEMIRAMLCGKQDGDTNTASGLLAVCGDVHYSHVAARAALNLVVRLIDVERNKDAQFFIDAMLALDTTNLRRMNLATHIVSERGNRLAAFKLIHAYRTAASSTRASLSLDTLLANLLSDSWAAKEYTRWVDAIKQSHTNEQRVKAQGETNTQQAPNITEQQQQQHEILHECAKQLRRFCDDPHGWKRVENNQPDAGGNGNEDSNNGNSGVGGGLSPLLELKRASLLGDSDPLLVSRVSCYLPHSVSAVSALLADDARRREWDVKFQHLELVPLPLHASLSIALITFKSFASPYKHREALVLRGVIAESGDCHIHCCRSVAHSSVPENPSRPRAIFHASGFVVEAEGAGTRLTILAAGDREATLINAPDWLGETNEVTQNLQNLHALLERGR